MAKVILFGEHSVVYGHPAVAVPLHNLHMTATVERSATPTDPSTLNCLDWHGSLDAAPAQLASVVEAVEVATDFAGHPDTGLHVTTQADFPPERGLGSSAAAAGAVIRAVLDAYGVPASPQQLFDLTQEAERIAHGHPSGLDALTTASPAPVYFRDGAGTALDMNLTAWIVIADSGQQGSTRETVGDVRRRYERAPESTGALLDRLGAIADGAVHDLRTDDAAALGQKMDDAQQLLADLGISSPRLDALTAAARDAGAFGAKLTGGGRGGCVIALARTREDADRIAAALTGAGASGTWIHAPHSEEVAS
ncbi:mevalonate kinase [Corynebacterium sp. USCH3]|uniref:mevalonate kinase n=1 Tax=Corynebacterium sp. USCH3 TaxID=3024840 RepID=UPI0030A908D1